MSFMISNLKKFATMYVYGNICICSTVLLISLSQQFFFPAPSTSGAERKRAVGKKKYNKTSHLCVVQFSVSFRSCHVSNVR